jgi:hypothetical protein
VGSAPIGAEKGGESPHIVCENQRPPVKDGPIFFRILVWEKRLESSISTSSGGVVDSFPTIFETFLNPRDAKYVRLTDLKKFQAPPFYRAEFFVRHKPGVRLEHRVDRGVAKAEIE